MIKVQPGQRWEYISSYLNFIVEINNIAPTITCTIIQIIKDIDHSYNKDYISNLWGDFDNKTMIHGFKYLSGQDKV